MLILSGPWEKAGDGGPGVSVVGDVVSLRVDNGDRGAVAPVEPFFHNEVTFRVKAPLGTQIRLRMCGNADPNRNWAEWNVGIGTGGWEDVTVDTRLRPNLKHESGFYRPYTVAMGVMFNVPNVPAGKDNCFFENLTVGEIPYTETFDRVIVYRKQRNEWLESSLTNEYGNFWQPFISGDDNVGDQIYFGSSTKFDRINVLGDIFSQVEYEYLSVEGWKPLATFGDIVLSGAVTFIQPDDWALGVVNGGDSLYYVRATTGYIFVQSPEPKIEIAYR